MKYQVKIEYDSNFEITQEKFKISVNDRPVYCENWYLWYLLGVNSKFIEENSPINVSIEDGTIFEDSLVNYQGFSILKELVVDIIYHSLN